MRNNTICAIIKIKMFSKYYLICYRIQLVAVMLSVLLLCVLLSCGVIAQSCVVELQDNSKGIHVAVESCKDTGTFSIGGLSSEGIWERLTYFYPTPWKGTFLSVSVDGRIYTNSVESQDRIFMDSYVEGAPEIVGDSIVTSWRLPGDVVVEERLKLINEGVMLNFVIINEGPTSVDAGIRLHIDTMLGENDGAPVYIPGDGLKSREAEYLGRTLNFKYWKAYNTIDNPSMIATGVLDEESYPDKVIVANWKKSIYSSWNYTIDPTTSILGDSAVILYYDLGKIDPGEHKTLTTQYLNGEPILPASKGYFGIAEIIPDDINTIYCPDTHAIMKVDVISRRGENEGQLLLEIKDEEGNIFHTKREYTGIISADSVKTIPFRWQTPGNISPTYFDVVTILYDMEGEEIDRKEIEILVDYTACGSTHDEDMNWMLIMVPLFLALFAGILFVVIRLYSQMGGVEITKEKEGELVKVTVWNKKKTTIKNCRILDRITEGAEVDITTSGVKRKGTELVLYVAELKSEGKAILEYRIKAVESLPPAIVRWDSWESVSR